MQGWVVASLIFAAVAIAMAGQAWASWLEHKQRMRTLDVIKAAVDAGREPPAALYAEIHRKKAEPPWTEFVVFAALSFGFWLAYAILHNTVFMVVAASMTVTALGCLWLALAQPGARRDDDKG
ncbi:MAG: hypothetical protein QM759_06255 [Terricaulis sp.]